MPLFSYDFHAGLSDDPQYTHGEVFKALDEKTGEEIHDVIAYDQRSTRLDRWADLNGEKHAFVECRAVRLVFPGRGQGTTQTGTPEAVAADKPDGKPDGKQGEPPHDNPHPDTPHGKSDTTHA